MERREEERRGCLKGLLARGGRGGEGIGIFEMGDGEGFV